MMMGPTKKKIIMTGVVAFLIPVIISMIVFIGYSNSKNAEIEALRKQGEVINRYVFARNMIAGDIITANDLKIVSVKTESAPKDSFSGGMEDMVGQRMRINAEAKTIVTKSMFSEEDDTLTIDERYQEFNMIALPSDLNSGDFIDVRLSMPEGEDYLVISGKEVKNIGVTPESNSIFLQLTEEEIIRTTAAILESYLNDGYKLYANKYVDPDIQLYDSTRVNYVAAFEKALERKVNERQKLADENPIEYLITYKPEIYEMNSGDLFDFSGNFNENYKQTVKEDDITTKDIAIEIGLTEKQTEDIRLALEENDKDVLELYNDKLVVTRKNMTNTYPVKVNIANLIKQDPNILQNIKDKYNVESLMEQRSSLLEFPLYEVNDYGEVEMSESMQKIQENINKEIETQRAERKEYLQALILNASSTNN